MVTGYLEVTTMPMTIQHLTCNEVVSDFECFWLASKPPETVWYLLKHFVTSCCPMAPVEHETITMDCGSYLKKNNCYKQKILHPFQYLHLSNCHPNSPLPGAYRRRRWRFIGDRATSSSGSHRWTKPRWWTCNCTWRCLLRRSRSRIAPQSSRMERLVPKKWMVLDVWFFWGWKEVGGEVLGVFCWIFCWGSWFK